MNLGIPPTLTPRRLPSGIIRWEGVRPTDRTNRKHKLCHCGTGTKDNCQPCKQWAKRNEQKGNAYSFQRQGR